MTVKILKVNLSKKTKTNPLETFSKIVREQFKYRFIIRVVTREFNFVAGHSEEKEVKRHELEQKNQVLTKTLRQSCE